MLHKRVRVDDYTTDSRVLRITGRSGYETSTDLWIERAFGLKFRAVRDEDYDRGWHLAYDDFYSLDWEYTRPNLHGEMEIDLIKGGGLNDSMENLLFKPVGCDNHYNCYPKMQRKILPYLIPFDRWGNVEFMTKYDRKITMGAENNDAGLPHYIWWDPTHNGNFVVTYSAGQGTAKDRLVGANPNPESIAQRGFCPRDLIQFGVMYDSNDEESFFAFDANPTLLPVHYDADGDVLHWNSDLTCCVRVEPEIFGSDYFGDDAHYFLINRPNAANHYDFDAWTARFDQDGVAGRNTATPDLEWLDPPGNLSNDPDPLVVAQYQVDLAAYNARLMEFYAAFQADEYGLKNAVGANFHYVASLDTYAEFYPLILWSPAFQDRLAPASGAIPNVWGALAGVPGSGTNVNEFNELVLWLRIPRFSKGQPRNWSMHPGLARFTEWFDKEVDGDLNTNPQVAYGALLEELVPFQHVPFPTQWHQLAYTPPEHITSTKVGTWSTQWAGVDEVVFNTGAHHTVREPVQFIIDLPGPHMGVLWNYLLGLPALEVITFKLVGGVQIIGPLPTMLQQQQGYQAAVDPNANREFYLRFQRRHALFTALNNSHQLTFDWTHLSGYAGGGYPYGEFPDGTPFTCGTQDLYPRGPFIAGWIETPAPGNSLIMEINQTNFVNLNQFYMSNATERPNSWNEGSKPLYVTEANVADQYQRHDKEFPQYLDEGDSRSDLFVKMNAMFQGDVFIESPILDDYRTVKVGQNKAEITLREPLFALESGMSTYGVKRIFNNNPWYSLLLQDIDLFFQPTQARQTIFKDGNTLLEIEHNGIERVLEGVTMEIMDVGFQTTTVTVRTRDGRDQRTKMLLEASNPYPFIRLYKGLTRPNLTINDTPTVTISIYSERGIPDWFFIFGERELPPETDYIPDGNPIVSGLNFFHRTNKSRSLCSYMLSKHELWQATRRNSHPEADLKILLEERGGILIGKADIGTLEFDELSNKDCFDYDLDIMLENEIETAGDVAARVGHPITVTVAAIYENGVVLKGGGTKLSFVEIKERNY